MSTVLARLDQGEAVGFVTNDGFPALHQKAVPPPGSKLYAAPAAVAVDGAMVERAIKAHAEVPHDYQHEADYRSYQREAMRAALTAALQPAATSKGEKA